MLVQIVILFCFFCKKVYLIFIHCVTRESRLSIKYLALGKTDRVLAMGFDLQAKRIVESMDMPPWDVRRTLFSTTFLGEIHVTYYSSPNLRVLSTLTYRFIFFAIYNCHWTNFPYINPLSISPPGCCHEYYLDSCQHYIGCYVNPGGSSKGNLLRLHIPW
jgi:hypothetical protein